MSLSSTNVRDIRKTWSSGATISRSISGDKTGFVRASCFKDSSDTPKDVASVKSMMPPFRFSPTKISLTTRRLSRNEVSVTAPFSDHRAIFCSSSTSNESPFTDYREGIHGTSLAKSQSLRITRNPRSGTTVRWLELECWRDSLYPAKSSLPNSLPELRLPCRSEARLLIARHC